MEKIYKCESCGTVNDSINLYCSGCNSRFELKTINDSMKVRDIVFHTIVLKGKNVTFSVSGRDDESDVEFGGDVTLPVKDFENILAEYSDLPDPKITKIKLKDNKKGGYTTIVLTGVDSDGDEFEEEWYSDDELLGEIIAVVLEDVINEEIKRSEQEGENIRETEAHLRSTVH